MRRGHTRLSVLLIFLACCASFAIAQYTTPPKESKEKGQVYVGVMPEEAYIYVDGKPVYAGDHLRWVYDIHLLCSALNTGEWSEFAALARKKGIAQFCIDGLNAAREAFNAQIPDDTIDSLLTAADNEGASVQKLRTSPAVWFLTNLRALPNLGQRIALTKQVILPPSAYMMEKYQTRNWLALSFLYVCRSVLGIFEWLKRSKR